MNHDTRNGLSMFGSRFQAAARRLLHAAAFLASVGAVTACAVDAGESVEEPTATAAESQVGAEPLGAEAKPLRGRAVRPTLDTGRIGLMASEDPRPLQTPPVKIRIFNEQSTLVAMVALRDDIGSYRGQTEYWRAAEGLRITGDIRIEALPSDGETENSISEWLDPLVPAFETRRLVSSSDWSSDPIVPSPGMTPYLLYTPSPDNPEEILGLLLQVSSSGVLTSAAWYRSSRPDADGHAFYTMGWKDTMTLLLDREGAPAWNPNEIRDDDWHNILMPLPAER